MLQKKNTERIGNEVGNSTNEHLMTGHSISNEKCENTFKYHGIAYLDSMKLVV